MSKPLLATSLCCAFLALAAASEFSMVQYSRVLHCQGPRYGVSGELGKSYPWVDSSRLTVREIANDTVQVVDDSDSYEMQYGVCTGYQAVFRGHLVPQSYKFKAWSTLDKCPTSSPRFEAEVEWGGCLSFGNVGLSLRPHGRTANYVPFTMYEQGNCSGKTVRSGEFVVGECQELSQVGKVLGMVEYVFDKVPQPWVFPPWFKVSTYSNDKCNGPQLESLEVRASGECYTLFNSSGLSVARDVPFSPNALLQIWPDDWMQTCKFGRILNITAAFGGCVQVSDSRSLKLDPEY